MSKDPAFLFYYQDFLVGTDHMNLEQVGAYVRCLCHQANRGTIREEHMLNICKTHDNHMIIIEKFKKDINGELFNERLRLEVEKRKSYSESRRMNKISSSYVQHMENENITEDEAVNTTKKGRVYKGKGFKKPTMEEVKAYCLEIKSPIDPEYFFNNYESQGWIKANGQPILNWKLTIKTWEKRNERTDKNKQSIGTTSERDKRKAILDNLGSVPTKEM